MSTIFISYRRADARGEARLLYRDLVERFGKTAVFMDVTGMTKGRDFRTVLDEELATCRVALVVIGAGWLVSDSAGSRRLDDEQDFVRREVATILRRPGIPVIPVLVSGAVMPRAAALPEDIRDLAFREGVELTHARWESDIAALSNAIESHVEPVISESRRLDRRYVAGGLAVLAGAGTLAYLSMAPWKQTAPVTVRDPAPTATSPKDDSTVQATQLPSGAASVPSLQALRQPPTVAPLRRPLREVAIAPAGQPTPPGKAIRFQPEPAQIKDIWTTSVYSNAPGGGGPGGGLHNDLLLVGGWADLYYSLIQFELSDPKLPRQATSATLRLFASAKPGAGSPTSMTLHRITEPWDWRTRGTGKDRERLWWLDKPATVPLPGTSARAAILPPARVGDFYDIDITDLYNAWLNDPSKNFGLELRPTHNQNNWNQFSSSSSADPSRRPQLVVIP